MNWADDNPSSGKKFKFIHVILVSIVFLCLGSYLAKMNPAPSPEAVPNATIDPTVADGGAEKVDPTVAAANATDDKNNNP